MQRVIVFECEKCDVRTEIPAENAQLKVGNFIVPNVFHIPQGIQCSLCMRAVASYIIDKPSEGSGS